MTFRLSERVWPAAPARGQSATSPRSPFYHARRLLLTRPSRRNVSTWLAMRLGPCRHGCAHGIAFSLCTCRPEDERAEAGFNHEPPWHIPPYRWRTDPGWAVARAQRKTWPPECFTGRVPPRADGASGPPAPRCAAHRHHFYDGGHHGARYPALVGWVGGAALDCLLHFLRKGCMRENLLRKRIAEAGDQLHAVLLVRH